MSAPSRPRPHVPAHGLDAVRTQTSAARSRTAAVVLAGAAGAHPGPGTTLWLTGLSGAGKTTIADALAERLRAAGVPVEILDGDELRDHLSPGLGFSREERDAHVTRVGYLARLLARHGVTVLVPVIAPYAAARERVRAEHEAEAIPFRQVYVATPVAECARRDVKGLYAAHARGEVRHLTGVDDPYEPPAAPDLVLDTTDLDLAEAVRAVTALLASPHPPAPDPLGPAAPSQVGTA